MTRRILFLALLATAWPVVASAQLGLNVRTAVLYEGYDFDAGLAFNKVTQTTIPVAISFNLRRIGNGIIFRFL